MSEDRPAVPRILLSHAVAPTDGPIPSRLKAVGAVYGITVHLPWRAGPPCARAETALLLDDVDVVLAVVGRAGEDRSAVSWVEHELHLAQRTKIPILLLVEPRPEGGSGLSVPPEVICVPVVRADRGLPVYFTRDAEVRAALALRASLSPTAARAVEGLMFATVAFWSLCDVTGSPWGRPKGDEHAGRAG